MEEFTGQFKDALESNVCDTAKYEDALGKIAAAIKTKLSVQCVTLVPRMVTDIAGRSVPACLVGDVPEKDLNGAPAKAFPACSAGCCIKCLGAP